MYNIHCMTYSVCRTFYDVHCAMIGYRVIISIHVYTLFIKKFHFILLNIMYIVIELLFRKCHVIEVLLFVYT